MYGARASLLSPAMIGIMLSGVVGCGAAATPVAQSISAAIAGELAKKAAEYFLNNGIPRPPQVPPPVQNVNGAPFIDPGTLRESPQWFFDGRYYVHANNYGGWNYYFNAPNGRVPVGFSAFFGPTGQLHYFNAAGFRVQ